MQIEFIFDPDLPTAYYDCMYNVCVYLLILYSHTNKVRVTKRYTESLSCPSYKYSAENHNSIQLKVICLVMCCGGHTQRSLFGTFVILSSGDLLYEWKQEF